MAFKISDLKVFLNEIPLMKGISHHSHDLKPLFIDLMLTMMVNQFEPFHYHLDV